MIIKLITTSILISVSIAAFCQSDLNGTINDASNNKPLAYVNIGIKNRDIGTVSDADGKFSISLVENYDQDSVTISSIGYQVQLIKVSEFRENAIISLEPIDVLLPEISISNKVGKKEILGNNTQSKTVKLGFTSNLLGNEIGVKLKIKRPTTLKEFNVFIIENEYDKLQFRLNVYKMKNGKPDRIILNENILVPTEIKEGLLTVDLVPFNIVVDEDVVVGLEWIEDLGNKGLYFSGKFFGAPMYFRKVSQGNWEKSGKISVGFFVLTES